MRLICFLRLKTLLGSRRPAVGTLQIIKFGWLIRDSEGEGIKVDFGRKDFQRNA